LELCCEECVIRALNALGSKYPYDSKEVLEVVRAKKVKEFKATNKRIEELNAQLAMAQVDRAQEITAIANLDEKIAKV
jgi:hypothetical protein